MPVPSMGGTMHVCPVCGKDFFIPDLGLLTYKRSNSGNTKTVAYRYFCSWSCFRKDETLHPRKTKRTYELKEEEWEY